MTTIEMRRKSYEAQPDNCQHAGLMLERGFTQWDTENNRHAEQRKKFYDKLTAVNVGLCYKTAFQRWQEILQENTETSKTWVGKLDGRLYLGLGEANPLESAVTLHHTYGVPFIPGSTIKGVVRHAFLAGYALSYDAEQKKYRLGEDARQAFEILFGREPDPKRKDDIGNAGYIVFNDAWWIPEKNKNPLAKEIVTVHHQAYYTSKGEKPASDFDSPNPNPQLAIQGSFLFSLEGAAEWADFAMVLLQETLNERGIGAKTASGYGFFKIAPVSRTPQIEIWPNALLGSHNQAGMGNIIQAVFEDKKAVAKLEELPVFFNQLSKSQKKKLNKTELRGVAKVMCDGNSYHIIEVSVNGS